MKPATIDRIESPYSSVCFKAMDRSNVRLDRVPVTTGSDLGNKLSLRCYSKLSFKVDAQAQSKNMYSASGGDCPEFQDYGYSHISMVFFMNGMSGAMQEPFAITRRCDEPMRRIIQLRGSSAWRRTRNGRDFRQVR
jgi:hypothetical protein